MVHTVPLFVDENIDIALHLLICQPPCGRFVIVHGSMAWKRDESESSSSCYVTIAPCPMRNPAKTNAERSDIHKKGSAIHLRYDVMLPSSPFLPSVSLKLCDTILLNFGDRICAVRWFDRTVDALKCSGVQNRGGLLRNCLCLQAKCAKRHGSEVSYPSNDLHLGNGDVNSFSSSRENAVETLSQFCNALGTETTPRNSCKSRNGSEVRGDGPVSSADDISCFVNCTCTENKATNARCKVQASNALNMAGYSSSNGYSRPVTNSKETNSDSCANGSLKVNHSSNGVASLITDGSYYADASCSYVASSNPYVSSKVDINACSYLDTSLKVNVPSSSDATLETAASSDANASSDASVSLDGSAFLNADASFSNSSNLGSSHSRSEHTSRYIDSYRHGNSGEGQSIPDHIFDCTSVPVKVTTIDGSTDLQLISSHKCREGEVGVEAEGEQGTQAVEVADLIVEQSIFNAEQFLYCQFQSHESTNHHFVSLEDYDLQIVQACPFTEEVVILMKALVTMTGDDAHSKLSSYFTGFVFSWNPRSGHVHIFNQQHPIIKSPKPKWKSTSQSGLRGLQEAIEMRRRCFWPSNLNESILALSNHTVFSSKSKEYLLHPFLPLAIVT
eukprot:gene8192-9070_t